MRDFKTIVKAITKRYHWVGLLQSFIVYKNPFIALSCYIFGLRVLDNVITLKGSPPINLFLSDPDDLVTVHEIFVRNDYPISGDEKIILDIGGNIGISSKYFHLKAPLAKVVSFEPDPRNFAFWEKNHMESNVELVHLMKIAVVPDDQQTVEFTQLPSGRYGGVGISGGKQIMLPAMSISKVIDQELKNFDKIDLLKLDIENLELEILEAIKPETLNKINKIYVELPYGTEYQIDGFLHTIQGQIHKYERIMK